MVAALVCTASCTQDESVESKCDTLRHRIVSVRIESLPEADRAAHAAALGTAMVRSGFASECAAMTAKQLECALAAGDVASCL